MPGADRLIVTVRRKEMNLIIRLGARADGRRRASYLVIWKTNIIDRFHALRETVRARAAACTGLFGIVRGENR